MPIDPNTGMSTPDLSPVPQGIGGGALGIENAVIGANLAQQAQTRRDLETHMMDLQGQTEAEKLNAFTQDRQWAAQQHANRDAFAQWVQNNPNATLEQITKQGMAHEIDPQYMNAVGGLAYKEGMVDTRNAQVGQKSMMDVFNYVDQRTKAGIQGQQIAGELGSLMQAGQPFEKAGITPQYLDQISKLKIAPVQQAGINKSNADANKANSQAGQVGGTNEQKLQNKINTLGAAIEKEQNWLDPIRGNGLTAPQDAKDYHKSRLEDLQKQQKDAQQQLDAIKAPAKPASTPGQGIAKMATASTPGQQSPMGQILNGIQLTPGKAPPSPGASLTSSTDSVSVNSTPSTSFQPFPAQSGVKDGTQVTVTKGGVPVAGIVQGGMVVPVQ